MITVKNGVFTYSSDAGQISLDKHEIRKAEIYPFEGHNYLLISLIKGTQMEVLPDYPPCPLQNYCIDKGYHYCFLYQDTDPKDILAKLQ